MMTETDSHGENGSSCDRFGEVKLIFSEIEFGDMLIFSVQADCCW